MYYGAFLLCTRTRGTRKGHCKTFHSQGFMLPPLLFSSDKILCALLTNNKTMQRVCPLVSKIRMIIIKQNYSGQLCLCYLINHQRLPIFSGYFFPCGYFTFFWQIELNYIIISLNTIFPRPSKVSHYLQGMYRVSHTKAFSGRGGCEVTLHPFFPTPFYIACPQFLASYFLLLI